MNPTIQYGYTHCPKCNADLDGGMIPVERRSVFANCERYSLLIQKMSGMICPQCRKTIDIGRQSSTGNSK